MGVIGIIMNNLRNMKRAKKFRAMTNGQLLAMDDADLYDAVACICEDAVYEITEPGHSRERVNAYALLKFEMEVNNGGLCQFFVNSSRECAPFVSNALAAIEAWETKSLFDGFVSENGIDLQDLSSFKISSIGEFEAQTRRFDFDSFDDRFYEDCRFHELLMQYLRENLEQIVR